jgi:catalase (peroxidase I)
VQTKSPAGAIQWIPANGQAANLVPDAHDKVLKSLEDIQRDFNGAQSGGRKVSLADVIVLGGAAAIEQAAKQTGHDVKVPNDAREKFVQDFVAAWTKVMNLDRFDL